MDYGKLVQEVIEERKGKPDILGTGDLMGEDNYLNYHNDEYVRTVGDIDRLYENNRGGRHILEIGSFLGIVSISLKRLGYEVYAIDIPEFQKSTSLGELYRNNGIDFVGLNLRRYKLPYRGNFFDAVILCEVLEHLNFNPLPILMEINRVLKTGAYIYIGMPNQSRYANRKKLILGKSIHNSIDDFFAQLDRNKNMIVGLHWREYTLLETTTMIEKMGFQTYRKYYYGRPHERQNLVKVALKKLMPSLLPSLVVVGKKISMPNYDFWLTEANS